MKLMIYMAGKPKNIIIYNVSLYCILMYLYNSYRYADDGYVQKHISWSQILANSISEMEMVFNAKRIKLNQFSTAHNVCISTIIDFIFLYMRYLIFDVCFQVKYFRVLAKVLSIDSSMPIWYESCARHLRRADMCEECDPSFSRPRYFHFFILYKKYNYNLLYLSLYLIISYQ